MSIDLSTSEQTDQALLASLVEAVLADSAALEASVVKAAVGMEPNYQVHGPDLEDLTASVHANLARVLQAFLAGEPDDEAVYDAPRETGRRRAAQGFPLEAVLRAYRLGFELVWEALLAEARSRGPEATSFVVGQVSRLWFVMDRFSLVMAEAYRQEEERLRRLDRERQAELLADLLDGRGGEPAVATHVHRIMGLPHRARYLVVVATSSPHRPGASAPQEHLAAHAISSFWTRRRGREVGVVRLEGTSSERLCALLSTILPDRRVGVSHEVDGLADISRAYRHADLALATLPEGRDVVASLDDRLPEALMIASPELTERLVQRALGELHRLAVDERDALLDTARAWFAHNQCTAATARALHCHRNTVLNRIARFQQVTGTSLEDERDRLVCQLALTSVMGNVHNQV